MRKVLGPACAGVTKSKPQFSDKKGSRQTNRQFCLISPRGFPKTSLVRAHPAPRTSCRPAGKVLLQPVRLDFMPECLGLYLKENNYAMYAAEIVGLDMTKLQFNGYSTSIDEYYSAVIRGESAGDLRQNVPARITELIDFLSKSQKQQRSFIASFFLDAAGDQREDIARIIDEQLKRNAELSRTKSFSSYGDYVFTLWVWSPSVQRDVELALKHTRGVLAAAHEEVRLLIELEYDADGVLIDVHWRHVSLKGISAAELAPAEEAGNALRRKRVVAAMRDHKIGVNEPCPCGSGKKFKKCCRR